MVRFSGCRRLSLKTSLPGSRPSTLSLDWLARHTRANRDRITAINKPSSASKVSTPKHGDDSEGEIHPVQTVEAANCLHFDHTTYRDHHHSCQHRFGQRREERGKEKRHQHRQRPHKRSGRPASSLPARSLAADLDRLEPIEKPWKSPAPRLAAPRPTSSWFAEIS